MKSRRQELFTNAGRITRSKTSLNRGENSLRIPVDLIIEILSRLPTKSIARCRCVSKFLASVLRLPYFTELFLTRSSAHAQILFACQDGVKLFFFTSPQLQNADENSSLVVAANHLRHVPFVSDSSEICGPVRGWICRTDLRVGKGRKGTLPLICNPSTGQILNLPKLKSRINGVRRSLLGYDPIGKQYKLLCATWSYIRDESIEYHVMTLGTKTLSWRKVECCMSSYHPGYDGPKGICINGSLYYGVWIPSVATMILCFDVRSEKFRFIEIAEDMRLGTGSTLVNYNGKLAVLLGGESTDGFGVVTGETRCIELWVLEDTEKHEWSKHITVLPPLWNNVVTERMCDLEIVGLIGMNEIVFSPHCISDPYDFYVYYLNIEKNTIVRVRVRGLEAFRHSRLHVFPNYVENVELMQAI